jgi:BirA family biotin operon repressor/biotin-[acetyl-CoA-carboxylase] ligase
VADYQTSPRGRSGLPWTVEPGRGLGFSLLSRPDLTAEREGWSYVAASLALAASLDDTDVVLEWPDTVLHRVDGARLAALGTEAQLAPGRMPWVVVTVLVDDALPPRAPLLGRVVSAIEDRLTASVEDVRSAYVDRCSTLGRRVTALMIPMGPGGPQVTGTAVDVLADGALLLETRSGRRVAVRPQNLGLIEPAGGTGR